MTPIVCTTEAARPPERMFAYVPSRFREWQQNVISGRMDEEGPHGIGAKCHTTRRIGFAEREVTSEITHIDPPRTMLPG